MLIYNDYAIRIGPICHYILVCEEWPGAAVPLWFRLSSDARLRRVRRPRCLADRGDRRVRTDVTSYVNARPTSRGHGCGCPQPATEFVAQRCPLVVDPMCRKPGSDDIDAAQRKHRNEQMALDPFAQLVLDRAQPEFGLARPECRFQFSQSPVGANRILNAPLRVAGAQDIMARSGIAIFLEHKRQRSTTYSYFDHHGQHVVLKMRNRSKFSDKMPKIMMMHPTKVPTRVEPTLTLPWASILHIAKVRDGPQCQAHTLCHYPMITWNHSRRGALQLFGNVHNNWRGSRNSVNVGVDVWDFMPMRFEDIARRAKSLPMNKHWTDVEHNAKDFLDVPILSEGTHLRSDHRSE